MNNNITFTIKLALLSLFSLSVCAEVAKPIEKQHLASTQKTDDSLTRTGLISAQELINDYASFKQSYTDFEPQAEDVKNLQSLVGMDVVVFMGLWCHDSQREVPHLLKLIEQAGNPFNSVKIVAINTEKELADEYSDKFEVTHTPTIFVLKDEQILATIIETPKGSIAQDLVGQVLH